MIRVRGAVRVGAPLCRARSLCHTSSGTVSVHKLCAVIHQIFGLSLQMDRHPRSPFHLYHSRTIWLTSRYVILAICCPHTPILSMDGWRESRNFRVELDRNPTN